MAAKTRLAARQTQMLPPACGLVSLFFFCVSRGAGLAGVVAKGATAAAAVAVVAAVGATSTPAWFAVLAAAVAEIAEPFSGGPKVPRALPVGSAERPRGGKGGVSQG